MCGIAGIINLQRNHGNTGAASKLSKSDLGRLVTKMADCMVHRGPDDSGAWVSPDGHVAFSHRRLSIIDTSSAGHQPMLTHDQRCAITFNGEIYNYLDLRNEWEAMGGVLHTKTDTEMLLEFVRKYGKESFRKFDGMYAFAFYDLTDRHIILGRDPFGEKPLYYLEAHGYLAFASELNSLAVLPWFDFEIDKEAIAEYFAFQYVPAPRSIYKSVKKLLPGSYMTVGTSGEIQVGTHFEFKPEHTPKTNQSLDALADELGDILTLSTKRRMMSDVPLGAFLSGGVDSTATVAVMTQVLKSHVKTFSLGSSDSAESEHLYARQMAERLGAEHFEFLVTPDVPSLVQHIGQILDEPIAESSCLPTYLLSEYARKKVTVLLSGDGGDEMFAGYSRYFATLDEETKKNSGDEEYKNWKPSDGYFGNRIMIFNEGELKQFLGEIPPETKAGFESYKAKVDNTSVPLISRLRAVDMANYLPGAVLTKVDRMSMQHALEVRTPFLCREMAKFAEKLAPSHMYADGQGKLVLKEYLSRFVPYEWLERRKQGFSVPLHLWNRRGCLATLRKLTTGKGALLPDYIGADSVSRFIAKQELPNSFSEYQVWALLTLEIWLRSHTQKLKSAQSSTRSGIFGSFFARGESPENQPNISL